MKSSKRLQQESYNSNRSQLKHFTNLFFHPNHSNLYTLRTPKPIPSKKNSASFGYSAKLGRMMAFGNPAYHRIKDVVASQIQDQHHGPRLYGPLTLIMLIDCQDETWFWDAALNLPPTKFSGTDVDNKLCSIFDLFKLAGVIYDDCQFVRVMAEKRFGKTHGEYQADILIGPYKEFKVAA